MQRFTEARPLGRMPGMQASQNIHQSPSAQSRENLPDPTLAEALLRAAQRAENMPTVPDGMVDLQQRLATWGRS